MLQKIAGGNAREQGLMQYSIAEVSVGLTGTIDE